MSEEFGFPITVSPYLTVKGGTAAIDWYEKVLGATCNNKMMAEDGVRIMHATLMIQNNPVMLSDEFPEFGGDTGPDRTKGSPVAISVTLDDPAEVDRIYTLAIEEGGTKSFAPENMFWGDRFGQFYDPYGHRWMLTARLADGGGVPAETG